MTEVSNMIIVREDDMIYEDTGCATDDSINSSNSDNNWCACVNCELYVRNIENVHIFIQFPVLQN